MTIYYDNSIFPFLSQLDWSSTRRHIKFKEVMDIGHGKQCPDDRMAHKCMQPVWIYLLSGRPFEDSFENTQWRKVKQMQPMWLYILSSRTFEDSFENTQWTKAKQMQPMWLCILLCTPFEETFDNGQYWKVKKCNHCDLASSGFWGWHFEVTFENKSIFSSYWFISTA